MVEIMVVIEDESAPPRTPCLARPTVPAHTPHVISKYITQSAAAGREEGMVNNQMIENEAAASDDSNRMHVRLTAWKCIIARTQ